MASVSVKQLIEKMKQQNVVIESLKNSKLTENKTDEKNTKDNIYVINQCIDTIKK